MRDLEPRPIPPPPASPRERVVLRTVKYIFIAVLALSVLIIAVPQIQPFRCAIMEFNMFAMGAIAVYYQWRMGKGYFFEYMFPKAEPPAMVRRAEYLAKLHQQYEDGRRLLTDAKVPDHVLREYDNAYQTRLRLMRGEPEV